jgi:hypothetical protein
MVPSDTLQRHVSKALASCPSQFTQLLLLASMRDPYTGLYRRVGQADQLSSESNAAMRAMHQALFETVSNFTLVMLAEELRECFALCGETEMRVVQLWLDSEPYHQMIPEGCPLLPRKYFVSQICFALKILAHAPDWGHLNTPRSMLSQQGKLPSVANWPGLSDPPPFKM